MIVGMVLPALLAGGAAYGAARAAAKAPAHAEAPAHREVKPPGPTVALDPFLVSVQDASKKAHPIKLTVAVEFEVTAKEDMLKPFMPRVRDAILSFVRTLSYEEMTDPAHSEQFRTELLERCHKIGATDATRILITDLVSQ